MQDRKLLYLIIVCVTAIIVAYILRPNRYALIKTGESGQISYVIDNSSGDVRTINRSELMKGE